MGVQVCNAAGDAFGACACGGTTSVTSSSATSGSSSATTTTSTASSGTGGASPCAPGAVEICYEGPAGTENVGVCKGGTRICDVTGTFGACMGQMLPTAESCTTPVDENCDGQTPACAASWVRSYANESSALAVTHDPMGNVYIVGQLTGSIDFGGGTTLTTVGPGVFVTKLDPGGVPIYSLVLDDPIDTTAPGGGIVADASGNLYLSFEFTGSQTLLGTQVVSEGEIDIGLAKLGPTGIPLWLRTYGSTASDDLINLELDANGDLAMLITNATPIYFGGPSVLDPGQSVVKLASDGAFVAQRRILEQPGIGASMSVVPGTDELLIVSTFQGVVDFGNGPVDANQSSIVALRLDGALDIVDSATMGPIANYAAITRARALPGGGGVAIGTFNATFLAPPLAPLQVPPWTGQPRFVIRVDDTLTPVAAAAFDANQALGYLSLQDVVVKGNGDILVSGNLGGAFVPPIAGFQDGAFLLELDPTCAYQGLTLSSQTGGTTNLFPYALDLAPDGVPVIAGWYNGGPIVFGPHTLPASAGSSAFVARLAP